MSEFLTTIMFLSPVVLILFFMLQSKIGKEQKKERYKFVEENPHLEEYLRRSPIYQNYYSTRPQMEKVRNSGGMTDEQRKKLIEEMWTKHHARLKEIHESKEKTIAESITNRSKTVRSKRKP